MRVWICHLPRKIQIREAKATRSPPANAVDMSLSKFFNTQTALVKLPRGPTLKDCGCPWQRLGVYVCNSVRVKSGVDEKECVLCKYSLDKLGQKVKVAIESYKASMWCGGRVAWTDQRADQANLSFFKLVCVQLRIGLFNPQWVFKEETHFPKKSILISFIFIFQAITFSWCHKSSDLGWGH